MELSVVIPSAGKWPRLTAGLRSLVAQRLDSDAQWEILVVADGVQPPPELLAAFPDVRFEHAPVAGGRGSARNRGVRAARGRTVVLLDDDMVVTTDFVQAHLAQQHEAPSLCHGPIRELPVLIHVSELSPLCFVHGLSERAARRIQAQAETVVSSLADPDRCFVEHGQESQREAEGTRAWMEGRGAAGWVAFAGANLSAPREWLLREPFDERAGTRWGLEDLALALRWWVHGRPLSISPRARALHLTHPRGAWRDDLSASAGELDFVPPTVADAVVAYLRGEIPLTAVETQLSGLAWNVEPGVCK